MVANLKPAYIRKIISVSSHRSLKSESKELMKSPATSRSSGHSEDAIDVVMRSIKDDTKEQHSRPTTKPYVEKQSPVLSSQKNEETKSDVLGLHPDELFKEFEKQVSLESKSKSLPETTIINETEKTQTPSHSCSSSSSSDSDSESGSCEALIRSLQRAEERKKKRSQSSPDNKENDLTSPSNIRISKIKSDDDLPVVDSDLKQRLNESQDEAAIAKEAILSPDDLSPDKIEVSVSVEIAKPKTELDTPPETPDNGGEDIDKEIDALEKGIQSGIFRIKPYNPPIAKTKAVVDVKPISVSRENTAPTPPETPPNPARRGQSLRDKIRGLHESRQKLMAATTDTTFARRSPERVTPSPKVTVPKRRLPNSQSSQESIEKPKPPPVPPKPTDIKRNQKDIIFLQTNSSDDTTEPSVSVHSSSSTLSSSGENVIDNDPKHTKKLTVAQRENTISHSDSSDEEKIEVIVSEVPEVRTSATSAVIAEELSPEKLIVVEPQQNKSASKKSHLSDNVYTSPPKPTSSPRQIESLDELISSFSSPVEVTMATEAEPTHFELTAETSGNMLYSLVSVTVRS